MFFPEWPSGVMGMLLGAAAGILLIVDAWRRQPWDVHDEKSYAEADRFSFTTAAPSIISFLALVTLLLGTAVLDREGLPWQIAVAGDFVGLLVLPFTVLHLSHRLR